MNELDERMEKLQSRLEVAKAMFELALEKAVKAVEAAKEELNRKPDYFDKVEEESENPDVVLK